MRKFSIRTRVTIWYVFFLIILVCLVFVSLIYTSNRLIQKNVMGDLTAAVEDSCRDVKIKDGILEIDDDMVTYRDGVYILVYKENNFVVTGSLPAGVKKEIPFKSGQVRRETDGGREFYVYDHLISDENFDDVWVRGVTSADLAKSDPAIAFMMKMFLIALPLLILLAALGGYYITKRAFRPVFRISETARRIEASKDLSQRIGLDVRINSKDELYELAATFDRMLDRLQSSFEAEKQFSNDASHELRTPISVIMAQCEYALRKASSLEEAQAALDVILAQSKTMSALVSQLLMLARADQGTAQLEFERINVSDIADMVALEQADLAARRNISIQRDIQPDVFACVDETLFMRIYINLISNGIKYGKEGGFIRVTLKKEDDMVISQVIDDGIGISPEDLPKIWDRFYQVNPSRSTGSGSGLGLSMVKWIVSAHGGTITADSVPGKGTRFTISLPLNRELKKEENENEREDSKK
ncbi:HAMP domain-containing histidine kinase [Anaerovorax odorimutans]|uniref:histidine kinase n=1 Tax=Anaerovorax odorimutans TaxID=109327 RepID=A0ABT1RQQ6_9FIRM|nr:HAMP domain-containing sensor histidine kinase [Anaerovorax odorimutans]MCQ4637512.1 HAMP domain-containing histidine kinase [Anaerovorax odorimutans]